MNIVLSYVSYPVTTAVYFERALRKNHHVITLGPELPQELIQGWNLENMKLPITPHDIPTDFKPDLVEIFDMIPDNVKIDLFLWIESVDLYRPKNISSLKIPTACYLIDSHIRINEHFEIAKEFNYVFIAQREYLEEFTKAGIKNVYWLPLGCDPEVHKKHPKNKKYDVGFVGSFPENNPRRQILTNYLGNLFNFYSTKCYWDDMAKVFSSSKLVFNNAVNNDLNMRLFEVMSTESLLLTDLAKNSGQEEMFFDGEDLAVYEDKHIKNPVEFFLENDELRETIAKRGKEIIQSGHKYSDRTEALLDVIFGDKNTTPTAQQWREKSLQNITVSQEKIGRLKRSFVIPVLDYSPASEYNIKTLLKDLENIPGNVIVVFNSVEVANEMKDHPRIDYYSILNKNVGVARAWNIGLHMSTTPITFILNSDLHIEEPTVKAVENAIINYPDVAVAGPQGSYFNFDTNKDIVYFDKGTFDRIQEVDGVSGFLFAVKTKYFHDGQLIFENKYSPCYKEEWDIGLQAKRNNLKCLIVPTTSYEHHWSGSIRALKTIKYLNKEETPHEILLRNEKLFKDKWVKIVQEEKLGDLFLKSLWLKNIIAMGENFINKKEFDEAERIFNSLIQVYPQNTLALNNLAVLNYLKGNTAGAKNLFNKVLTIEPENETALENISLLEKS